jgi:Putative ATP-dependent DNA helicase recG C-terminal
VSYRDYQLGSNIFVRQYPRRIEMTSPGGLPFQITLENLLDRQSPRNRRLADIFLCICQDMVAASVGLVPAVLHGLGIRPPPCPRAVAIDLQHRVVLLNGFGGFGQVDGRDGILSQPLERLPNLARSERVIDTVQESEPRPREDHPGEDQQLLIAERHEVLPVPLHVEPASPLRDGPETGRAQGRQDLIVRGRPARHEQKLAECHGGQVRPLGQEKDLIEGRAGDLSLPPVPDPGGRPEQGDPRGLVRPRDQQPCP